MKKNKKNMKNKRSLSRHDILVKYFFIVIGAIMILESFIIYDLTSSISDVISPSLVNLSTAYVFLRLFIAITIIGYSLFWMKE